MYIIIYNLYGAMVLGVLLYGADCQRHGPSKQHPGGVCSFHNFIQDVTIDNIIIYTYVGIITIYPSHHVTR